MKAYMLYACAAAVVALPVGWFFAGFIQANSQLMENRYRPLYLEGDYTTQSIATAAFAFVVVGLVGLARQPAATKSVAK